jgi:predicted O-methyltransferase YrrM
MLKQTIKALFPEALTAQYDDIVDRHHLSTVAGLGFEAGNLRPEWLLDVGGMVRNVEAVAAWDADRKEILSYYWDSDMLLGVNPGDRQAIYFIIMAIKPRRVLEIGTHIGASTMHIATALRRIGDGGALTTVDIDDVNESDRAPWREAGMSRSPAKVAEELSVGDIVQFVTSPARDFLDRARARFDLIFLDGSHASSDVYREVCAALRVLNPNGVILLHDYYPEGKPLFPDGRIIGGPYRAMVRIQKENPEIEVVPFGKLPWPTKQGTSATTLAFVARRVSPS